MLSTPSANIKDLIFPQSFLHHSIFTIVASSSVTHPDMYLLGSLEGYKIHLSLGEEDGSGRGHKGTSGEHSRGGGGAADALSRGLNGGSHLFVPIDSYATLGCLVSSARRVDVIVARLAPVRAGGTITARTVREEASTPLKSGCRAILCLASDGDGGDHGGKSKGELHDDDCGDCEREDLCACGGVRDGSGAWQSGNFSERDILEFFRAHYCRPRVSRPPHGLKR